MADRREKREAKTKKKIKGYKYNKYDEVAKRERDKAKKGKKKRKGRPKDRGSDSGRSTSGSDLGSSTSGSDLGSSTSGSDLGSTTGSTSDVSFDIDTAVVNKKKLPDIKAIRAKALKEAIKKENAPMKSYYKQAENFDETNALVYDTPKYLLPSELKRVPRKERRRREDRLKKYMSKKQEPYRCIRTCIDPKTAKIKYQEYICYPPPPCPPSQSQHPHIAFPEDCKCDPCSPESCRSKVCEVVRGLRAEINYEEPSVCEPITVCVPVPDPPPPQMICTDCPLEIRLQDGDFHIINAKNYKKHIKKMNKEMKKLIEDWEKKNQLRKMRIKRFCT